MVEFWSLASLHDIFVIHATPAQDPDYLPNWDQFGTETGDSVEHTLQLTVESNTFKLLRHPDPDGTDKTLVRGPIHEFETAVDNLQTLKVELNTSSKH